MPTRLTNTALLVLQSIGPGCVPKGFANAGRPPYDNATLAEVMCVVVVVVVIIIVVIDVS